VRADADRAGRYFILGTAIIFAGEKGVIAMNQKASDQGWQQLQSHIEGFFSQALRSDTQRIEYKPRFIDHLLEMRSERQQNEIREMGA
jgi:hypothetical protein